ncbi:RNB-domain-containing protein [Aaosphaeria arxii CBS 175.79]|uniref:RNB-domain-containing protein n=1 Tax=Aaosphaeria arxii CBS 175.79 TaxID=1450172 RepID=A0A6A5XD33_9PLEO|nr:RNB-domain-containing protein [Aaosphaeria arxii CBS 175.79]KAF2010674.1 RNB-domain-containing protein [Aaosphaeria arxii CBS 175.79]
MWLRASSRSYGNVCWECHCRLAAQRRAIYQISVQNRGLSKATLRRTFYSASMRSQISTSATQDNVDSNAAVATPIRERLKLWQDTHGGPDQAALLPFENHPLRADIQNTIAKLSAGAKSDVMTSIELDEEQGDVDDSITIGLFLKPGDVVELSSPDSEPVLAVFVQQLDMQSQFYTVSGRWSHLLLANVTFAIQRCIDPSLIVPLVPFLPTKPSEASIKGEVHVPQELGAPIQRILEDMTNSAESIYRENSAVLDGAYQALADRTRTRMMTLHQIASTLLAPEDPSWKPSPAALLAVRKALHHNEFRFPFDSRSHRLTNVFSIRAIDDVAIVENVREWVREFGEFQAETVKSKPDITNVGRGATYISSFIDKARHLIRLSRKHRDPLSGYVGPRKSTVSIDESHLPDGIRMFTPQDQQIIKFLKAWVLTAQFERMPNLHSACTAILHATQCYGSDVYKYPRAHDRLRTMGRETGNLFLQEIGVIAPFENRALYDEHLMLPTIGLSRNLEILHAKAELTRRNPDFRDSMSRLRKDWGKLNVYCIDDIGAKEIDDGVSIERVEGHESEVWIHVHVANPTAFFDKSHVLTGLAAHLTETVYTPERTFSMLPAWVSQNYFSIEPDRPVLTFSTKLDLSNGVVLDKKIQPGMVNSVISITPGEVANYLREARTGTNPMLIVGKELLEHHPTRISPKLSSHQVQELQDLYAAARILWRMRAEAGAIRIKRTTTECKVYNPGVNRVLLVPPSTDRPRYDYLDPVIEVMTHVPDFSAHDINARNIVEEMMLLACQTAASWCAERNIPVMYRGTVETPSSSVGPVDQFLTSIVRPYIEEHGQMSPSLSSKYLQAVGRSISQSSPLRHRVIGAHSYLRVTSPLRRFSDMMSHWQIEAALQYEARTGKTFNYQSSAESVASVLPFSRQQVQESIITLIPRERLIRATQRISQQHWTAMALMRAYHNNEAPLPRTFKVALRRILDNGGAGAIGSLSDYSVGVVVESVPGFDFKVHDEWEVKIREFELFTRYIHVTPIRLLRREDLGI